MCEASRHSASTRASTTAAILGVLSAVLAIGCQQIGLVDGDDLEQIAPPMAERCNGEDDDWDLAIDEGLGLGFSCVVEGVGRCSASGVIECVDGVAECVTDSSVDPQTELCNGLDDDCDGTIDEGYSLERTCTAGVGRCEMVGRYVCERDDTSSCGAEPDPARSRPEETGDEGVDDDCDGTVDEQPEVCNGRDDDLDGITDEGDGFALCGVDDADDQVSRTASLRCRQGECIFACLEGQVDADGDRHNGCECTPAGYDIGAGIGDEPAIVGLCPVADGVDDDCDGRVDEHPLPSERRLAGVCSGLSFVCDGESWRPAEVADAEGRVRTYRDENASLECDLLDNDCDERIDEGLDCSACRDGDGGPPCHGCAEGTSVPLGFACIAGGDFAMGSADPSAPAIERPVHDVTVSGPLAVQVAEVTQREWCEALGQPVDACDNPSTACDDPACPVDKVTWFEAVEYANRISEADGKQACYTLDGCRGVMGRGFTCDAVARQPCDGYRLPTEAEWEYVARAGGVGAFGFYGQGVDVTVEALLDIAWYAENTGGSRRERKLPNDWGLFDMLGNVGEWVEDWYGEYPEGMSIDPVGPDAGDRKIWRGGSWTAGADSCRVSSRAYSSPGVQDGRIGFRLVRVLDAP